MPTPADLPFRPGPVEFFFLIRGLMGGSRRVPLTPGEWDRLRSASPLDIRRRRVPAAPGAGFSASAGGPSSADQPTYRPSQRPIDERRARDLKEAQDALTKGQTKPKAPKRATPPPRAGSRAATVPKVPLGGALGRVLGGIARVAGPLAWLYSIESVMGGGITPEQEIPKNQEPKKESAAEREQRAERRDAVKRTEAEANRRERDRVAEQRRIAAEARAEARDIRKEQRDQTRRDREAAARARSAPGPSIVAAPPTKLQQVLGSPLVSALLLAAFGPKEKGNRQSITIPQAAQRDVPSVSNFNLTGIESGGVGSKPSKCKPCAKRKPRKPRKPRTVCYKGSYVETATGTRKRQREIVPCQ